MNTASSAEQRHLDGEDCGGSWWGGCRLCGEIDDGEKCERCEATLDDDGYCPWCEAPDTGDIFGRDAEERALRIGAA